MVSFRHSSSGFSSSWCVEYFQNGFYFGVFRKFLLYLRKLALVPHRKIEEFYWLYKSLVLTSGFGPEVGADVSSTNGCNGSTVVAVDGACFPNRYIQRAQFVYK